MSEFEQQFLSKANKKATGNKVSTTGKWLIGITGGIGIGLTLICAPFVSPALRKYCLPYVPATTKQVQHVISMLPKHKKFLLDIGSGDGRICIEAAKNGYISHGVELNLWLVYYSRFSALRNGVLNKTKFFCNDLWKFNTTPYNCIVIFGVEQMMTDLEAKLVKELKPKTRIIACRFPLPTLKHCNEIGNGVDTVWTYET